MSHDETACLKCGRCCRKRISAGGEIFVLPQVRCEHLDLDTKLCRIYDKRFELRKECLTVEQGIHSRAYPKDCPYVKGLVGYRPPIEVKDEEAIQAYLHWW